MHDLLTLHGEILVFFVDLIEAKVIGCFDLLDEESKLPTPKPDHFTMEVHNRNKGHPRLDVRRKEREIRSRVKRNLFFSCRENRNYVHREKYEMMKVFSSNILLVVWFIRQ